jgi:hypothetical protein
MFELANVGVDGVNIHTGNGGGYALFSFVKENGAYALESIRPEYYGLLLFQLAAPPGSRLLPVSLSTTANLKVWATVDDSGTIRVVVINKDELSSDMVSIEVPGNGCGDLTRLQSPALDATDGIVLGGQTFDESVDGTLQGEPIAEPVVPSDGIYSFSMPSVSAALLTITPAQ